MSSFDPRLVGVLVDVIQFILIGIGVAVMWARKPGEEASADLPKIRERVSALEQNAVHAATSEDIAELRESLQRASTQVEGLQEGQRRTNVQLDRIETYLLNARAT